MAGSGLREGMRSDSQGQVDLGSELRMTLLKYHIEGEGAEMSDGDGNTSSLYRSKLTQALWLRA